MRRWRVWLIAALMPALMAALIAALVATDRQSDEGCEPAPLEMRSLASDLNSVWQVTVKLCPLSNPSEDGALGADALGAYDRDRGVVYIRLGELHYYDKQGLPDGIGLMYVMGHEWGHHLQSVHRSEYADRYTDRDIAQAQADCLSGYFLASKYPGLTKFQTESLFGVGERRNSTRLCVRAISASYSTKQLRPRVGLMPRDGGRIYRPYHSATDRVRLPHRPKRPGAWPAGVSLLLFGAPTVAGS